MATRNPNSTTLYELAEIRSAPPGPTMLSSTGTAA